MFALICNNYVMPEQNYDDIPSQVAQLPHLKDEYSSLVAQGILPSADASYDIPSHSNSELPLDPARKAAYVELAQQGKPIEEILDSFEEDLRRLYRYQSKLVEAKRATLHKLSTQVDLRDSENAHIAFNESVNASMSPILELLCKKVEKAKYSGDVTFDLAGNGEIYWAHENKIKNNENSYTVTFKDTNGRLEIANVAVKVNYHHQKNAAHHGLTFQGGALAEVLLKYPQADAEYLLEQSILGSIDQPSSQILHPVGLDDIAILKLSMSEVPTITATQLWNESEAFNYTWQFSEKDKGFKLKSAKKSNGEPRASLNGEMIDPEKVIHALNSLISLAPDLN